jgi:hypothetical protein
MILSRLPEVAPVARFTGLSASVPAAIPDPFRQTMFKNDSGVFLQRSVHRSGTANTLIYVGDAASC